MHAPWLLLFGLGLLGAALALVERSRAETKPSTADAGACAEIEEKLKPLAQPFVMTDWQRKHQENGQSFQAYLKANPVRRSKQLSTVYLCLLGDFKPEQAKVLDVTREYLGVFFGLPRQGPPEDQADGHPRQGPPDASALGRQAGAHRLRARRGPGRGPSR